MADTRTCEQCGTSFTPRREHARFCTARCRVAWNRRHASDPTAETGPLDWSLTAMRESTSRLLRAGGWDRAHGFAAISEAVWWVTMVDATLVRYHPDPEAEFIFLADPAAVPADATPFDMRGAALGHHHGRCSFETALAAFGLDADPALEEIGRIVHEADLADERYDAPAAAGLDVLIRGLTLTSGSDHDTLTVTGRLFDGLYEHTRRQLLTGRPPA